MHSKRHNDIMSTAGKNILKTENIKFRFQREASMKGGMDIIILLHALGCRRSNSTFSIARLARTIARASSTT